MVRIGVDIGGTNISVGLVDENLTLISKKSCKTATPRTGISISRDISQMILTMLKEKNFSLNDVPFIGVGCPGCVDRKNGIAEYLPNMFLKNWKISEQITGLLHNKEIRIENDATAAAYGEYIAGSCKGCNSMVMITLGTGVGGAAIINGKIFRGINNSGPEVGHMVIKQGGRKCRCSRCGCFETYASARALALTTKEFMKEYPKNQSLLWKLAQGDLKKVSGRTAFEAAKSGDRLAKKIVKTYISQLACGITNLINIFEPEIFCIGGGVSNEEDKFFLYPLKSRIEKMCYNKYLKNKTQIVKAKFGNDSGIIGAAILQ